MSLVAELDNGNLKTPPEKNKRNHTNKDLELPVPLFDHTFKYLSPISWDQYPSNAPHDERENI